MDSLIGKTLSRYRILERIGAGGMGVVYRALDERLNRDVAMKVLPPDALADEGARNRFRKEARALSKLKHPNIATVHDFDTSAFQVALVNVGLGDKDAAFAVLEEAYRERSTLLTYLKMDPRFDPLRSDPRFQDLLRRPARIASHGRLRRGEATKQRLPTSEIHAELQRRTKRHGSKEVGPSGRIGP